MACRVNRNLCASSACQSSAQVDTVWSQRWRRRLSVTVRLLSLSLSHLRSSLVKFTTSRLTVLLYVFNKGLNSVVIQEGSVSVFLKWLINFWSSLWLSFLFFFFARWWWLPDCRAVFEEGVWQPRDLRLEVFGGWEVYPRSQGSAENQVQCTTLSWSFCGSEDWEGADNETHFDVTKSIYETNEQKVRIKVPLVTIQNAVPPHSQLVSLSFLQTSRGGKDWPIVSCVSFYNRTWIQCVCIPVPCTFALTVLRKEPGCLLSRPPCTQRSASAGSHANDTFEMQLEDKLFVCLLSRVPLGRWEETPCRKVELDDSFHFIKKKKETHYLASDFTTM